jgi:trimethylamine--corrinoid protein Co-methyltransferase
VRVDAETIAADLIRQTGPAGSYITADHTLQWLRKGEYLPPRVSVRAPFSTWQAEGGLDTYQTARRKVREHQALEPSPIDPQRARRLAEILASFPGG